METTDDAARRKEFHLHHTMNESRKKTQENEIKSRADTHRLDCLYRIEELLQDIETGIDVVFRRVAEAVPSGFRVPSDCRVRITYQGKEYSSVDFESSLRSFTAPITIQEEQVGALEAFHVLPESKALNDPFLPEEQKFLLWIAKRLGEFLEFNDMSRKLRTLQSVQEQSPGCDAQEWHIAVDLCRKMDTELYRDVTRKLLNQLCFTGVAEASAILAKISSGRDGVGDDDSDGENRPRRRTDLLDIMKFVEDIYEIAESNLPPDEILTYVQKWLQEDRASFLMKTLINMESSLGDIAAALQRFVNLSPDGTQLSESTLKGVRVSLIRRLVSDSLDYIKIAKNYVEIEDFHSLMQHTIYPMRSHGQLGGKSAGLFLAYQVLNRYQSEFPELKGIRVPQTWYITSDGLNNFLHRNNLEEVTEQKYKDIGQIRQEYPHIIQLFKNSQFTGEMIQALSMALDEFADKPIIVRSSSLLEDRFGAAFSGKYKSLFLANQGTKQQRLRALMDAIAEVYSSTYSPDPIEYRAERGLLDFKEEMGIIIQEVVGKKVGSYFLPSYAGVAMSNNEFRWSPRIKREDGLLRLVAGLGTRAVDRLSDDYPILIAPGQPNLRVNISPEEVIHYSPAKMDVIDLDSNSFVTVDVVDFMRKYGDELAGAGSMVSLVKDNHLQQPSILNLDFSSDDVVVTFEGLITKTPFIAQVKRIIQVLQDALGKPVDIEFASDGEYFYLLQCRPQGTAPGSAPAPIPKDIPQSAILFSANRYVSNGFVPDITHIVYIDPDKYSELESLSQLQAVGRLITRLNEMLPKRQFILIGPGRWGSRGDIRLGVSVTYSDINNCAMLIEIARKKGHYTPDLSFGTHFFQDLVESSIRYLPLYPDQVNTHFNEQFLTGTHNILPDIVPGSDPFIDVVRVIDIPQATEGKVVRVFMNADLDEAVAVLTLPEGQVLRQREPVASTITHQSDDHWRWRQRMAERIALEIDPDRFGVKAFYIFGSTKNATAGPGSDIDILIHDEGNPKLRKALTGWLEGWSLCLDEMNYLRTGVRRNGLLDAHLVTDEDIRQGKTFAAKIGAVTDAAKELMLKGER